MPAARKKSKAAALRLAPRPLRSALVESPYAGGGMERVSKVLDPIEQLALHRQISRDEAARVARGVPGFESEGNLTARDGSVLERPRVAKIAP
jgi:hypothetical protein